MFSSHCFYHYVFVVHAAHHDLSEGLALSVFVNSIYEKHHFNRSDTSETIR
ncbi:hypothetical protein O23A_p0482 [Aeromonas salmonicida]|nr:hypothetical protein O23A_p0482 [Aeromonas salmonicida]